MFKRLMTLSLVAALVLCCVPAFAAAKKKAAPAMDEQKTINEEYRKGVEAVYSHQWDAAVDSLTKVIDNPKTNKDILANAYDNRGTAMANKKKENEAIADFTKALEIKPNMENAYYDRARAYAKINKHAEAVEDLTKAIGMGKAEPIMAGYYKNRGISYLAMEKRDLAKADFIKAKQLNPKLKLSQEAKDLVKGM